MKMLPVGLTGEAAEEVLGSIAAVAVAVVGSTVVEAAVGHGLTDEVTRVFESQIKHEFIRVK